MPHFQVAIIGAGPAGCTLAAILTKAKIECSVFEGELSANSRHQGGTLDLHKDKGQFALKQAGLHERFLQYARFDAEAVKLANKDFKIFFNGNGESKDSSRGRPEIDRADLRVLLSDALSNGTIKWGHRLQSIHENSKQGTTLEFTNGVIESGFDLVVGADGAWSKVRPLLTTVRPLYSGVMTTRYEITQAAERYPEIHHLVNRGSIFAHDTGGSVSAQQMSDGSILIAVCHVVPEDYLSQHPIHTTDTKASKAHTLAQFADWHPTLLSMIAAADEDRVPWSANINTLPPGLRWPHRKGVTVIGDAAHLMTPFAGEGANMAMLDAALLGQQIVRARTADDLDARIASFEEAMFVRAREATTRSWDMMNKALFMTGGFEANVCEYAVAAALRDVPKLMRWPVATVIRAWFAWFMWRHPEGCKLSN